MKELHSISPNSSKSSLQCIHQASASPNALTIYLSLGYLPSGGRPIVYLLDANFLPEYSFVFLLKTKKNPSSSIQSHWSATEDKEDSGLPSPTQVDQILYLH